MPSLPRISLRSTYLTLAATDTAPLTINALDPWPSHLSGEPHRHLILKNVTLAHPNGSETSTGDIHFVLSVVSKTRLAVVDVTYDMTSSRGTSVTRTREFRVEKDGLLEAVAEWYAQVEDLSKRAASKTGGVRLGRAQRKRLMGRK